ncbi:MAG: polyprenyl synthetase family protein [Nitrospirae bacterium]|jgi:geranylgeranyl diphosphate synthase, type II|nr:polyprenyl synthetase family protein [Nitrospirota bacterium]
MDIKAYLKEKRELIDSYLRTYFENSSLPSVLRDAMKYSLFAGGKRIRPVLALASYEACGGEPKDILPQAAAIELIHTYSLIHDDLPAMDNDELRRGKPTNHKVFGEALAILAGDALLTEAFFMMTNTNPPLPPLSKGGQGGLFSPDKPVVSPVLQSAVLRVIREIALSAGASGMVGGQAIDILSENKQPDREIVFFIHLHKTAAMIKASVRIGAILSDSTEDKIEALTTYGENVGLAFQIIDDILDIEGTTEELGKSSGSDNNKKKMTYPSVVGLKEARREAFDLVSSAIDALRVFSYRANPLREIAVYLMERRT